MYPTEGLRHPALGAEAPQAAHAGLLPHHVVAQPRHRSSRGKEVPGRAEKSFPSWVNMGHFLHHLLAEKLMIHATWVAF